LGGVLRDYRLYCLDGEGHIHQAELIRADGDDDAISIARKHKNGALKCEVWQGDQLIAKLEATDLRNGA
jgi:hypothetical protein